MEEKTGQRAKCFGSGCGSIGRAVGSDVIGSLFESSHWQKFYVLPTVMKSRK